MTIDISDLNSDERRIVEAVIEGLRNGRTKYGPMFLAEDRRNLVEEGLEEARDQIIYITGALIQLRDLQGRKTP